MGWGRRRPNALSGLNLEQETTDAYGYRTMLSVHSPAPLVGALVIPSNVIFGPVPPNPPPNLILQYEEVRQFIDEATEYANLSGYDILVASKSSLVGNPFHLCDFYIRYGFSIALRVLWPISF